MPITDIKAFYDKYAGHGTSAEDIAKAEGCTVVEAQEAKSFLLQYSGFKMDVLVSTWAQLQFSKSHPYVPQPQDPNAVKSTFGQAMTQKTIAMLPESEFWDKMERLLARVIDN